jgi:hypothetical protein
MWRLRMYNESWYERFWLKLARYAGAGNQGRINKRILLNMGRNFVANRFVEVEARIDGKGGEPLPRSAKPELTFRLPAGVPENELPKLVVMKPKPGDDGWFSAKFQVRSPGEYGLELKVPETGDTQTSRFLVKEANPELDDTRPDFEALYRLASPAGEVLGRMGDAERTALKQRLTRIRPEPPTARPSETPDPTAKSGQEEDLRLYFDLSTADLIPQCMVTATKLQRNRGPIRDLWDEGFTVWQRESAPPIQMSYVLLAVVGLLSLEWLTRKLLRLA